MPLTDGLRAVVYERLTVLLREVGVPAGDVLAGLTAVGNFILGSALDLAVPR
jgi:hypothetical protein